VSTITYPDQTQLTSTALTRQQTEQAFQFITAQLLGLIAVPISLDVTLTAGSSTVGYTPFFGLYAGLSITASGLPTGTIITGFDGNDILVSNNATVSGSQSASVVDPNVWSKVRIGWQIQGQPGPAITNDTTIITAAPFDTDYSRMRDLTPSTSGDTITETDVYTRAWKITFTQYGPDSVDQVRAIRSGLIKAQFAADYLAESNLYINPDIKEPICVPDNFQGQWWERADLVVEYNEQITETLTVGTVASVEVKVYTEDGLISDFTVALP
jgi:hypothetical protein